MDKFASLQAFVSVVDNGSFSRAAERLDLAKSVVSRRVSLLEQALGVQLLQRTTRTQSLTAAGQQFHARATRLLADLAEAENLLIDSGADPRGGIRLAAPLSFGLRHLTSALDDFLREHPAIELDLDLNDRAVDLVDEGFDMAVRIGALPDSTLIARRLATIRFVTCASPDYLARYGSPSRPSDLARHVGLHYANVPLRQAWQLGDPGSHDELTVPQIRMRANNGDALVQAAAAGLGVINLPTFIAADYLKKGELCSVLETYRRPPVGLFAVYPPGRLLPRRLVALTDFLATRFGDSPYWDEALTPDG